LDLADLARAAKDRRGGEMRGENYRSTGGVREASANARGAGWASQHPGQLSGRGPHTGAGTPWLVVVVTTNRFALLAIGLVEGF